MHLPCMRSGMSAGANARCASLTGLELWMWRLAGGGVCERGRGGCSRYVLWQDLQEAVFMMSVSTWQGAVRYWQVSDSGYTSDNVPGLRILVDRCVFKCARARATGAQTTGALPGTWAWAWA